MARPEDLPLASSAGPAPAEAELDGKLGFLSRPGAFPGFPGAATRRETHMSWVFFAGDLVPS